MTATTANKSILAEVSDLVDGLTFAQQEGMLRELLEVLFADPKDYDSLSDYRVDVVESAIALRDEYATLSAEQAKQWDREAAFNERQARRISPAAIADALRRAA